MIFGGVFVSVAGSGFAGGAGADLVSEQLLQASVFYR
jgi:hypothetical protein